jgi:hypothetical protein
LTFVKCILLVLFVNPWSAYYFCDRVCDWLEPELARRGEFTNGSHDFLRMSVADYAVARTRWQKPSRIGLFITVYCTDDTL